MAQEPRSTRARRVVVDNEAIDPTANVLALSEASNKRQDDLREGAERLMAAQIEHIRVTERIRSDSVRDLALAESRRVDEQMALRASYSERLELAEAKRIDAIRAVDVNAVAVASQRASDQATVLATQVAQSAEALRALVATTAATVATSLQQLSTSLSTRLTTLEQGSYQALGKSTYQDPELVKLLSEVKGLSDINRLGVGRTTGANATWGIILGAGSFITVILAVLGFVIANFVHAPSVAPLQPQVIYVPSPAVAPQPGPAVAPGR